MSRAEKLATLANYINILRASVIDQGRKDEVEIKAAALAREIFPPMAKALAWVREQNGRSYGKDHEGRTKYEFGPTLGSNFRKTHAYSCDEMWCFTGENDDEARAACESHHQAKFKELLA